MPALKLHDEYSRRAVHDIFAPDAPFTPQAGTWGLQGIIELPDRPDDFVLFVTFGQEQGGHEFDEGISAEGVLRWQSQPRQRLADKTVQQLIAHDESAHSVHLFLRTRARREGVPSDYTYLGRLKYVTHDNQREQPVYFDWQLLSWPIPQSVVERMGLRLEVPSSSSSAAAAEVEVSEGAELQLIADAVVPRQGPRRGAATRLFKGRMVGDYAVRERAVLSFQPDGRPRYIEVKTSRGPKTSDYFLSPNEVAFSRLHAGGYELRRLYSYDKRSGMCHFFSMFGDIEAQLELTPTEFKVSNLMADDKEEPGQVALAPSGLAE